MQKGRLRAMAGKQNQNQALKYLGWQYNCFTINI